MTHMTPATTDWRIVLIEQGRTLRWLAIATRTKPRTVYAYAQGTRPAPPEWLAQVRAVLGIEEAA